MERRATPYRRLLSVFASGALIVGACSGGASPTASPSGPAGTPSGTAGATDPGGSPDASSPPGSIPTTGSGDLRYVLNGEPTTFVGAAEDLPTSFVNLAMYNALYVVDNEIEVQPDLAAEMPETSEDGLTWTVRLKDGVTFHDGTEMTAEDVVFAYQLLQSPNCTQNPDTCSSIFDNLESVEAVDDQTVRFQLKQVFAPFLVTGLATAVIMPKAAIEASFEDFEAEASAVSAEDVQALVDRVNATLDPEVRADCFPEAPEGQSPPPAPEDCALSFYRADMEAFLTQAGVELPPEGAYQATDDAGTPTGLDPEAYSQALLDQLGDLAKALASDEIDRIAASLKLLEFARLPVGTGPYKIVSYTAGQSIELARHDDYFDGEVGPARVFIPIIKDSATASAALQRGDIHWQQEIVSDALPQLQADPNLKILQYQDFGYYYIAFNLRQGRIYADKNLRKAFTMCIDHERTVQVATEGQGVPVKANVPPSSWAYNPDVPDYVMDVEGAKALIEESGWTLGADGIYEKDGQRLATDLYVRAGQPQRIAFAQLARDQLVRCGIGINVVEADFATVLLPLLSYPNNFDTYFGGWSSSTDPDDFSIFHSSKIVTRERPDDNNFPGWDNTEADRLLEAGRTTIDQDERRQIYFDFQEVIHEDVPYYFLWSDQLASGFRNEVVSDQLAEDLQDPSKLYYWSFDTWRVAE